MIAVRLYRLVKASDFETGEGTQMYGKKRIYGV
jgi:hypothetical protein